MTYTVKLINKNQNLDLRTRRGAVDTVIDNVRRGGHSRKAFSDVSAIRVIHVNRQSIQLEVSESGKRWHTALGKGLANKHNMRHFCSESNPNRMFKWKLEKLS